MLAVHLCNFLEIVTCIPQMTKWTINSRKHAKPENFSNNAKKVNPHPYGLIHLMSSKNGLYKKSLFLKILRGDSLLFIYFRTALGTGLL